MRKRPENSFLCLVLQGLLRLPRQPPDRLGAGFPEADATERPGPLQEDPLYVFHFVMRCAGFGRARNEAVLFASQSILVM